MIPFFSPSEIAAIQSVATPLFDTVFTILRPTIKVQNPDAHDYDPTQDYGDDDLVNDDIVYKDTVPVGTCLAWLYAWPLAKDISTGAGQIGTIDTHELRVPVGTDIQAMDLAVRMDTMVDGDLSTAQQFVVVATSGDDTWPDMLRAILRRREG
jgi:hypothetical protein